jgi:hypothetical protein
VGVQRRHQRHLNRLTKWKR